MITEAVDPEIMRGLARARDRHAEPFPLVAYPTKGGGWWLLHDDEFDQLCASFPSVDVTYECRVAFAWLQANADRRKTQRGMRRFLTAWMTRKSDGGSDHHR